MLIDSPFFYWFEFQEVKHMVKDVFYPGENATQHRYGVIVPGVNRLDAGIADRLLAIGFVSKKAPKSKGNPYQDGEGKFSTEKDDADGKRRYRKTPKTEDM